MRFAFGEGGTMGKKLVGRRDFMKSTLGGLVDYFFFLRSMQNRS